MFSASYFTPNRFKACLEQFIDEMKPKFLVENNRKCQYMELAHPEGKWEENIEDKK